MSVSPSRLNCCLIGENAMRHSISINIQGTHSISMLKCVIKKRMEPMFDAFAASEIRIWKVNVELAKFNSIKDENDIEGNEMLDPFATVSSEFPDRLERSSSHIHIIMVPPPPRVPDNVSKPLYALQALYDVVWGRPGALLSQQPVKYPTTVNDSEFECEWKACIRDVLDLRNYAEELTSLGFPVNSQLVISQEYAQAFEDMAHTFSVEDPRVVRGFAVIGRSGTRNSQFLLYLLVKRMQATLPVAIHTDSAVGYFLIDGAGVSFHEIYWSEPLCAHEGIWCLSDSNDNAKTPAPAFFCTFNARVVQVTPPQRDRFHYWMTHYGGLKYLTDNWEEEELALLA